MNVIFFGDSITQGLWDEKGGWASRIKQDIYDEHLENAKPMEDWNIVYMRASSSDTSRDLNRRIEEELENGMVNSSHHWTVVFSIGMNDCGISEGKNKVSKKEYRENVQKIIDKAKKLADRVIAVGLIPIDEEKLENQEKSDKYLNSEVKEYEQILSKVCSSKEVKFIPTFDKLADEKDWNQNLFDGLHPNSEGHKKIYEIVNDSIKAELSFEYSK